MSAENGTARVKPEDYSGQPAFGAAELAVKAEGPAKRPVVWLPASVKAWMVYCQSGEMRAHALKEAAFADLVNGWTIQWDGRTREYVLRKQGRATLVTTIKHEAYMVARSDGHRRTRYEVRAP